MEIRFIRPEGTALKEKNLVPLGANYFHKEKFNYEKGTLNIRHSYMCVTMSAF